MSGRSIFAGLIVALLLFPPASAFAAETGGETAAGTVEGEKAGAAAETISRDGAVADSSSAEPSPAEEPFAEESPAPAIADPIEPLNRVLFVVNDKAYYWVMKPVARGYRAVVPEGVRLSVRNFFSNTGMPIRFVNNLLQGKIRNSGVELLRFALNTTAGIGGLFDPAKDDFRLVARDEDLGQTFGKYGLGHGLYIVLPLLGAVEPARRDRACGGRLPRSGQLLGGHRSSRRRQGAQDGERGVSPDRGIRGSHEVGHRPVRRGAGRLLPIPGEEGEGIGSAPA